MKILPRVVEHTPKGNMLPKVVNILLRVVKGTILPMVVHILPGLVEYTPQGTPKGNILPNVVEHSPQGS